MEANSTVNLAQFGKDIVELRMHENCDFVLILTPFAHHRFLGRMTYYSILPLPTTRLFASINFAPTSSLAMVSGLSVVNRENLKIHTMEC